MQLYVFCVMIASVTAGRLDNTSNLPPSNAKSAGGNDNSLTAPNGQNSNYQYKLPQLSTQYLPSNRNYEGQNSYREYSLRQTPSSQYEPLQPSKQYLLSNRNPNDKKDNRENVQRQSPSSQYGPPQPFTQYLPSNRNSIGENNYRQNSQRQVPNSQYGPPKPSTKYLPSDISSNRQNSYGEDSQRQIPNSPYGLLQPSTQYLPSDINSNGQKAYRENQNYKLGEPELSNKYLPSNRNTYERNSQNPDGNVATLRFDNENNGGGSYKFQFETENKIKHEELGLLKDVGAAQEVTVVQGRYSYVGADGIEYTVIYIADENGFQASGDHLPISPPIPEEIQRSLDKNTEENAKQGYSSGSSTKNGYQNYQFNQTSAENNKESINVRLSTNQLQGIRKIYDEKYLPPQTPGQKYLPPNNPESIGKTGYQY